MAELAGIETPDEWTPEHIEDFQQAMAERPARAEHRIVEAGQHEPASFEWESHGAGWTGVPIVNGHRIHTTEAIDVHIDASSIPRVTLKLAAADFLKLRLTGLPQAHVDVADETREALISLGWTPPASGQCETPDRVRPCGANCDC